MKRIILLTAFMFSANSWAAYSSIKTSDAIAKICAISAVHCNLLKQLESQLEPMTLMIDPTRPRMEFSGAKGSALEKMSLQADYDPYGNYKFNIH